MTSGNKTDFGDLIANAATRELSNSLQLRLLGYFGGEGTGQVSPES